jgi:hypothetical protein
MELNKLISQLKQKEVDKMPKPVIVKHTIIARLSAAMFGARVAKFKEIKKAE